MQRCIGSNSPFLIHDISYSRRGYAQFDSRSAHTKAEWSCKLLANYLAWMHRLQFFAHGLAPLVIVHDLNLVGISIAPCKADSALFVDTNLLCDSPSCAPSLSDRFLPSKSAP